MPRAGDNNSREASVVLVGGAVLDLQAAPARGDAGGNAQPLVLGTSNPGTIRFTHGGVARNIAECLSLLQSSCTTSSTPVRPSLISAVGSDASGSSLLTRLREIGVGTEGVRRVEEAGVGTDAVASVFDHEGGLHVAVADVTTVQRFVTAEWIHQFARLISRARVVVVDANLSKEALKAACDIAAKASVPVWFEPVSCTKSLRGTDILPLVSHVSPNEEELRAMAEALSPSRTDHTYVNDIDTLLRTGVKTVVLTLGSKGAIVANTHVTVALSAPNIDHVVNVNGAGDSLVAGAVFLLARGCHIKEAIAFGMAVAKRTVESKENVPDKVDFGSLRANAERILATSHVVHTRQHAKL